MTFSVHNKYYDREDSFTFLQACNCVTRRLRATKSVTIIADPHLPDEPAIPFTQGNGSIRVTNYQPSMELVDTDGVGLVLTTKDPGNLDGTWAFTVNTNPDDPLETHHAILTLAESGMGESNVGLGNMASMIGGVNIIYQNGILYMEASSKRYKDNIMDYDMDPTWLKDLSLKSFTDLKGGNKSIGLIAEDVEKINPAACKYYKSDPTAEPVIQGINLEMIVWALLKVYQDEH